jgi:hypothetical protein
MGFRPPNYRQQRGDRDRAKDQKRKERLERREADAQKRRAEREALIAGEPEQQATGTPEAAPQSERQESE